MSNNTPAPAHEAVRNEAIEEYFWNRMWLKTPDNVKLFEAGFDHAYALLSKLRAPVADGHATFEAWAEDKGLIQKSHGIMFINSQCDLAREAWQAGRAALTSAPVAVAAQLPWHVPVQHWSCEEKAKLDAAPQASEAQCSCPSGDGSLRHPCAVHGGDHFRDATQMVGASEAVREQSAAFPVRPLGVFCAGKWTLSGTGQAFSHTDLDEAAFVAYRDALSAQPGAQRTGGSDA